MKTFLLCTPRVVLTKFIFTLFSLFSITLLRTIQVSVILYSKSVSQNWGLQLSVGLPLKVNEWQLLDEITKLLICVWFNFITWKLPPCFVCYMNKSGWRVLRVVLFLQMTTTLPLRLRHQNYPRRCTYEVFPKWQRLKGKNKKQFLKHWRKF